MDVFIENLVKRKMKSFDYIIIAAIIVFGMAVAVTSLKIPGVGPAVGVAIGFGVYYFSKSRNIEFEYCVTNGEIDVDKIIAQRKRKRIFSGDCKEFEIIAKVKSEKYTQDIKNIRNRIEAVSTMESENVYFFVTKYNGNKLVVYFEPNKRMLDAFKACIPKKVFE